MPAFQIRLARQSDAAALARISVDTWRTAYKGYVAEEFLNRLNYEAREKIWIKQFAERNYQQEFFAAELPSGEVVGFATCGPRRHGPEAFDAELYAIYVLPQHHRSGLGEALFLACEQFLIAQGFERLQLWVLEKNVPARRFYERLGGVPTARGTIKIGETETPEIGYGWWTLGDRSGRLPSPHRLPPKGPTAGSTPPVFRRP